MIAAALDALCAGRSLAGGEAEGLFERVVSGSLDDVEVAALVVALKAKGESAAELAGAARALRKASRPFPRPSGLFADVCGTGGDGASTWNVSTGTAFVAAALGLPVLKHGGSAVSSRSGSVDVLRALGVRVELSAAATRALFDAHGVAFLEAAAYHPALARVRPVRRTLGTRTVFNLLGPLVSPALPPVQLLGVPTAALLEPVAGALAALGTVGALVVHGGGLDELGLHAPSLALRVEEGRVERVLVVPEHLGLPHAPLAALAVADAAASAVRLREALHGEGRAVDRAVLALNAGALLWTARRVPSLGAGVEAADAALRAGHPGRLLERYAEASHAA